MAEETTEQQSCLLDMCAFLFTEYTDLSASLDTTMLSRLLRGSAPVGVATPMGAAGTCLARSLSSKHILACW